MVFKHGYTAFGYFIEAKDKNSVPRETKVTKTSFIFSLELERLSDGTVIGYPLQRMRWGNGCTKKLVSTTGR